MLVLRYCCLAYLQDKLLDILAAENTDDDDLIQNVLGRSVKLFHMMVTLWQYSMIIYSHIILC
jgi:hypothetical protein